MSATLTRRLAKMLDNKVLIGRLQTMERTLEDHARLFDGAQALDFGGSYGTSAVCLIQCGAEHVVGVEPDHNRVRTGRGYLEALNLTSRIHLLWVRDTTELPFADASFQFVLANAVLEHIPQPRDRHIRELWRVVAPGGYVMVAETPNKYWPLDRHTTGLWWVPWLPPRLAYRYARWRDRYEHAFAEWRTSGWRGLGYGELVAPLDNFALVPERSSLRQRMATRLRLPASVLDPYPIWVLQKQVAEQK